MTWVYHHCPGTPIHQYVSWLLGQWQYVYFKSGDPLIMLQILGNWWMWLEIRSSCFSIPVCKDIFVGVPLWGDPDNTVCGVWCGQQGAGGWHKETWFYWRDGVHPCWHCHWWTAVQENPQNERYVGHTLCAKPHPIFLRSFLSPLSLLGGQCETNLGHDTARK